MIPTTWKLYATGGALALLAAGGWAFVLHERAVGARDIEIRQLSGQVDSLSHRQAAIVTRYVHDTVEVARWRVAYQTIRDTINVHDTVQVRAALADADTTIKACTVALSRCDSIQAVNDTLTAKLRAVNALVTKERAGFWDRVGVWIGPAGIVAPNGNTTSGIAVGIGIKVWP